MVIFHTAHFSCLMILLSISFLTSCTPIVHHADPFYNYNDDFPRDHLPVIKPVEATRERPSSPWSIELHPALWIIDYPNSQGIHYGYGRVEELEKFAVKDGVIMAYSSYVDKEARAYIQDNYYHWFVMVPSKDIIEGFHTEDEFRQYIQTLDIQEPDWQMPDEAFDHFLETGCLDWFPECPIPFLPDTLPRLDQIGLLQMNTDQLNPKNLAKKFVERILIHVYYGTIDDVNKLLSQGPSGRKKSMKDIALHEWFSSLGDKDRAFVLSIIRKAVHSSIFSTLVVLDNRAGGFPIEDRVSEYALSVNTYTGLENKRNHLLQESIRFNASSYVDLDTQEMVEDLHDYFTYALLERGEIDR